MRTRTVLLYDLPLSRSTYLIGRKAAVGSVHSSLFCARDALCVRVNIVSVLYSPTEVNTNKKPLNQHRIAFRTGNQPCLKEINRLSTRVVCVCESVHVRFVIRACSTDRLATRIVPACSPACVLSLQRALSRLKDLSASTSRRCRRPSKRRPTHDGPAARYSQ